MKYLGDQCDDQSLVNNRFGLHSESFHGGVTSVIEKLRKSDFKFHKLEPMMVKDIPVISAIMKSHQNQI